jgi:hypothetical protein
MRQEALAGIVEGYAGVIAGGFYPEYAHGPILHAAGPFQGPVSGTGRWMYKSGGNL